MPKPAVLRDVFQVAGEDDSFGRPYISPIEHVHQVVNEPLNRKDSWLVVLRLDRR
jgi:hypothetical protein